MSAEILSSTPDPDSAAGQRPKFLSKERARRGPYRPATLLAGAWLILITVAAGAAPLLAGHDPLTQDLAQVQVGPGGEHLLGTDSLGRDLLARLLHGSRTTLLGVAVGVGVSVSIGVPLGLYAGYLRGRVDKVASAVAEILMSLPGLIILITVLAVYPYSMIAAMVTFGVLSSAALFRIVRNVTMAVAQDLYITAAKLAGLSRRQILLRHILPRIRPTVVAQTAIVAALALVTQLGLGFLGIDTRPPHATWGGVLQDASTVIAVSSWTVVPPVVVVTLTILAFGILGDTTTSQPYRLTRARTRTGRPQAPRTTRRAPADQLLCVEHLTVVLTRGGGGSILVDDVSFGIGRGEIVGLVGESGAGKSVTSRAILGLQPTQAKVDGFIDFDGLNLLDLTDKELHHLRGRRIALVGQEPMVSLDPTIRIGAQLAEAVRAHQKVGRKESHRLARQLLTDVRISDPSAVADRYPHEISGGMAQRVCIAVALAGNPELLIADEPTTALDVTVQAEILDLLRDLQRERNMAVLLVTHDWGVVADLCDRAIVLYAGQIVEQAATERLFDHSCHPYTAALRAADPHQQQPGRRLTTIGGSVPPPGSWPPGCRFADRCVSVTEECSNAAVPLHLVAEGHITRCIHVRADDKEAHRVP
ncbi:dipeptide/oligopeptide/nickel ABC transporter permease/ATP-binding protein [Streptomyces zagrosensis]|uniref:Peptide/nickel transport system permease protein n=1 Tax=Streptomyces zagrosensis TaxID=1042984 RepID=A0A7W9V284_9ACTN|nr:dipeptide/oligopeptide/nickel ABC transporter permease/ATP-binding protein [Streptomyces zagrosensis]MBB5938579.1 peptide/nickel transport system permease protein [Streptomyces zagrosensis]